MKKRKSLYSYIVLAFVLILIFMSLITSIYFRYARVYVSEVLLKMPLSETTVMEGKEELVNDLIRGVTETLIISSLIGISLVAVVAKHIIEPIKKITAATKKVATGDFTVSLEETNRADEIGELTRNFNKMVKELNSNEYLSKEFISNISHEFKTPIASIQGFTKLLQDENTTEEEKNEYISIIIEETERLANLSSNIQKLSKLENKELLPMKQEIALDEQIRKCIIILSPKLEDKNIDISMNDVGIKILGNEDILQQVWINLINNAIKYTNENGKIEINLSETKTSAIVEIKDNGIGIEEEKQKRIFEKFYQVDSSHATEGNGLGLAIVKEIIELHKGKISLESQIGKGSTFIVELPKEQNN